MGKNQDTQKNTQEEQKDTHVSQSSEKTNSTELELSIPVGNAVMTTKFHSKKKKNLLFILLALCGLITTLTALLINALPDYVNLLKHTTKSEDLMTLFPNLA